MLGLKLIYVSKSGSMGYNKYHKYSYKHNQVWNVYELLVWSQET